MGEFTWSGVAVDTIITSPFTNVTPATGQTFTVSDATGHPSPTATAPSILTLDRGTASEEKILVDQRAGTTYRVLQRGYDGTAAAAHTAGQATVHHTIAAAVMDTITDHVAETASPHTEAGLAAGAVTTAKIVDAAVTTAKVADDAITAAKLAAGAVGATELVDGAVTAAKVADGAIGTAKLVDDAVTAAKVADGAIDATAKLADGIITTAKLAAAVLDLLDPPGVPKPYTGAAAPAGHGLCDAATEYDGPTYPNLAALYGTGGACVNGTSSAGKFRLPNLKGRMLVGRDAAVAAFDTLHETGGSKDAIVVTHAHAHDHAGLTDAGGDPHTHEFDHTHGATASTGVGNQFAMLNVSATVAAGADYQAITGYTGGTTGPSPDAITGPASDSSHTHPFTTDGDSTPAGASGTDANLPPYRVVNFIMRLS